jgi:hypothetical protein
MSESLILITLIRVRMRKIPWRCENNPFNCGYRHSCR